MNKYIDVKVTIWERLHFTNDADMNKIIEVIKNSHSTNDVCDAIFGFLNYEILYDTEKELSLEENNGNATIEVFDEDVDEINPIWTNTVEENKKRLL